MDSITQGVLGAAAAQALMSRRLRRGAGLLGAIGGIAPDLDILIRSSSDPTVSWIFHRHFTHSLIFIPLGGLITAIPFLLTNRFREQKRAVIIASMIGYATHAPLDMFTNYGTQLFWPFTNTRVALDWIGVIDPVYTIPLWIGVIWTARSKNRRFVRIALLLTTLYIFFGGWQHHRAIEVQKQLATLRGQKMSHWRVMPAPGWLLLWRSVYVANGRLYADAIRIPWMDTPRIREGGTADATTYDDLPENAKQNAEASRRFWILNWFADGLIAPIEGNRNAIGDMRITPAVEGLRPLWGLQFDAATGNATAWRPPAAIGRDYIELVRSLLINDPRYQPITEHKTLIETQ